MNIQSVQPGQSHHKMAWLQYAGGLAAFVAVIAVGFLGFRAFAATPDKGVFSLYVFAVVAGVASFFSPCAFPLLPGYFSFYHLAGGEKNAVRSGTAQALRFGLAAALGVITFNLILGVIIGVLGTGVAQSLTAGGQFVRYFRGFVGVVLLTLGFAQFRGWNLKPTIVDAFAFRMRVRTDSNRGPTSSMYLYGLGYNAAGMGCTGPFLAGLMVTALASGGFASALTAFGVFSLTMGGLMLAVSGLVAASRQTVITRLKAATPKIKWVASIVLVGVGLLNLYSAFNPTQFMRLLVP